MRSHRAYNKRTLLLSCVAAGVLAAGLAVSASAAPAIAFSKGTIDFGSVGQGKKVNLTFPFKNTGDSELTIGSIRTSCGCTNAMTTAKSVPPGGSAKIEAVFNSGSFWGKVTKIITVETNDPAHRSVSLTATGFVKRSVEVFPASINFGTLKKSAVFHETVIVKPLDPAKFQITGVDVQSPFASAGKPIKAKTVKGAWEVPIVVRGASATPGPNYASVEIRTNIAAQPVIMVRVFGTVVAG